jgi:hypothetical protein
MPIDSTESNQDVFTITITNTSPTQIYYASVHAASNILQYFQIGAHSYPLESNAVKTGGPFAGNIPSYPVAPTAPTNGMVYFDQQLNLVQYYDGGTGSWIPTRADSIISGPYNPGVLGQAYLQGGALNIFNGKKWVEATSSNLQLRIGATFMPMARFTSVISIDKETPAVAEMFYDFTSQRVSFWDGTGWNYPNATNTLFNTGSSFAPAFPYPMTVEPEALLPPYLGQLFYNTTEKALNAWNGTAWNKVNTDQEGTSTSDKIAIGSDGSYAERAALIKILQGQLGWPQTCVELKEDQFNIAMDNALQNYRQLSAGAYRRAFILYKLLPNQQLYFLNSAIDKTDHIVDIHKIHRMGPLGVFGGGPNDVWSQAFAAQFYDMARGGGDILTAYEVQSYGEELSRIFAGELMFQWNEFKRELYLTRAIRGFETVIIECMIERSEQEIFTDRWCQQYIQNWALAELKMMLGIIRSKYASGTPGAAGTINLNGELLISEARQDMTELKEELLNYEYGGMAGQGNCSFLMG